MYNAVCGYVVFARWPCTAWGISPSVLSLKSHAWVLTQSCKAQDCSQGRKPQSWIWQISLHADDGKDRSSPWPRNEWTNDHEKVSGNRLVANLLRSCSGLRTRPLNGYQNGLCSLQIYLHLRLWRSCYTERSVIISTMTLLLPVVRTRILLNDILNDISEYRSLYTSWADGRKVPYILYYSYRIQ